MINRIKLYYGYDDFGEGSIKILFPIKGYYGNKLLFYNYSNNVKPYYNLYNDVKDDDVWKYLVLNNPEHFIVILSDKKSYRYGSYINFILTHINEYLTKISEDKIIKIVCHYIILNQNNCGFGKLIIPDYCRYSKFSCKIFQKIINSPNIELKKIVPRYNRLVKILDRLIDDGYSFVIDDPRNIDHLFSNTKILRHPKIIERIYVSDNEIDDYVRYVSEKKIEERNKERLLTVIYGCLCDDLMCYDF